MWTAMVLVLLLVGPATFGPTAARQATPATGPAGDGGNVYADPAGRFTVPIPTG